MSEVVTHDGLDSRLAGLQRTNGEAFMYLLFREYYRPLGNVVFRVVQDRAVTEDVLQDVFLRIWNNRETLVISTTYKAYLYSAALHAAVRHQQRHQRQVAWDDANVPDIGANSTAEHLDGQDVEQAVAAALATLPPQCRAVFLLSRQEGMSYQQIADALEVAPKTVENQMGKALRLMREHLRGFFLSLTIMLLEIFQNIF